jgi:hypothetical protein
VALNGAQAFLGVAPDFWAPLDNTETDRGLLPPPIEGPHKSFPQWAGSISGVIWCTNMHE